MLKIQEGFVLRNVIDEYIVMPVGAKMSSFNNLMVLNESGAFLWNCLKEGVENQTVLVEQLIGEYDVSPEDAQNDVELFLQKLEQLGVLES